MLSTMLALIFLSLNQLRANTVVQQHFTQKQGYFIEGGSVIEIFQREDMSSLKCARRCYLMCGFVMYSRVDKTCVTYRNRINQADIKLSRKAGYVVIYKTDPDWALVFRGQPEIGHTVFEYWFNTGKQDDNPLSETFPASCLRFDKSSSCDRHFRSYILDTWRNIAEVRYSLYREGREVRYISFNGTGTTNDSWFKQNGILSTSWGMLKNEVSIPRFSLLGFKSPGSRRSFIIFGPYTVCGTDHGLTFIIEKANDSCGRTWGLQTSSVPVFVYSLRDTLVALKTKEVGVADAMAVFVKFKDIFVHA